MFWKACKIGKQLLQKFLTKKFFASNFKNSDITLNKLSQILESQFFFGYINLMIAIIKK